MRWALAWDADCERRTAAPLWSRVFGNLGGVTGWHRTAKAIQRITLRALHIAILIYVDDAFWPGTNALRTGGSAVTGWVANAF